MPEEKESIGLIAGGGQFPQLIADAARIQGYRVVAVAHQGETDAGLEDKVDTLVWIKLGQFGHLIHALKKNGVQRALMAGTIAKRRMFSGLRPDLKGLALMSKMAVFHDDGILRAVSDELKSQGIEIIPSTFCLPDLLSPRGCLTKRRPSRKEMEDIEFGWRIAKELGRLDIGQCVVVRDKTVLALEAMEGTDATILRGGDLAREKAVVIKLSKPGQDLRFDVPTVGLKTLETMARVKASVLAIEANKTLLFDKSAVIEYADKKGIVIMSKESGPG
jgi:DUF1009 family protein